MKLLIASILVAISYAQTETDVGDIRPVRTQRFDDPLKGQAKSDNFGVNVAISDVYALIAATEVSNEKSGEVFVYKRAGNGMFVEKTILKIQGDDPSAWTDIKFGSAVAIDDVYAVVGGIHDTEADQTTKSGQIFIYRRYGEEWMEMQAFSKGDQRDKFGTSVGISGRFIIVGAPQDDSTASADLEGAAYIYVNDGTQWNLAKTLNGGMTGDAFDYFGTAVSIFGNDAIVGAQGYSGEPGKAYIFTYNSQTDDWDMEQLIPSEGGKGDLFGCSVAMHDGIALVGAKHADNRQGKVYVFRKTDNGWEEEAILRANAGVEMDTFGTAVSVECNYAVIGSDFHHSMGFMFLFERDSEGRWEELQSLTGRDTTQGDRFGLSVALSGNTAVVGSVGGSDASPGGIKSGGGYVFTFEPASKMPFYEADRAGLCEFALGNEILKTSKNQMIMIVLLVLAIALICGGCCFLILGYRDRRRQKEGSGYNQLEEGETGTGITRKPKNSGLDPEDAVDAIE